MQSTMIMCSLQDGDNYKLKNMLTGYVAEQTESASAALNSALTSGKSVYLNAGTYVLTDDVVHFK